MINSDGTFELEFLPEADQQTAKNTSISYNFNLQVDVTDEGGETRTATGDYRAGWVTVEANFSITESFVQSADPINVTSKLTTLNGKAIAGNAQFKVIRLIQPTQTLLPAELHNTKIIDPYAAIDKYVLPGDKTSERWHGDFDWQRISALWDEGEVIQQGKLVHNVDGHAAIRVNPVIQDGVYRIYYETKDAHGEIFKMAQSFLPVSNQPRINLPLLFFLDKSTAKVGENIQLFIHTGLNNQRLTLETYKYDERISVQYIEANKDPAFITIPIRENDRGGMSFRLFGIRDYQPMRQENVVNVPWDNKELKLKFVSFRDKIRPGTKQSLRILVQDYNGGTLPKNTVEVLAYMHDRSLAMFTNHTPQTPINSYPHSDANPGKWGFNLFPQTGRTFFGYFHGLTDYPRLQADDFAVIYNYGIGGPGARAIDRNLNYLYRTRGGSTIEETTFELREHSPEESSADSTVNAQADSERMDPLTMHDDAETAPRCHKVDDGAPFGQNPDQPGAAPQLRTDFSETAFFSPHLILEADGTVGVEFQVPDSATSWNVYAHAITKDFCGGSILKEAKTIKELIVRPYTPRFLREGDKAYIKVVINNTGQTELSGEVGFDIQNLDSGESILEQFGVTTNLAKKNFTAKENGLDSVSFKIQAPNKIGVYAFKVTATAGTFSDGELRPFPVLPSRIHLSRSNFISLNQVDKKIMKFPDLMDNSDPSRINEKLVVNIEGQLFFSVLSALPYLINYPYECIEQTFNRFFSTGIVHSIFDRFPSVAAMAKEISNRNTPLENLIQNDPNRRMTLEESPWLQQAQGGLTDNNDILNIFDARIVTDVKNQSLQKLTKLQLPSGGFPWFQGGPADNYMTLYLLMGMGRALEFDIDIPKDLVVKAWQFTQSWLEQHFRHAMSLDCCWEYITLVNYAVSLYPDDSWSANLFTQDYHASLLQFSFKHWKKHSPLLKGYLALTLKRIGREADAKLIWDSVMDSAQCSEALGTYWATEDRSWLWYQDNIESHAFSIRVLMELNPSDSKLPGLVQWLFLNKKLNQWKSTKATAEAIYALAYYLRRTQVLGTEEILRVDLGTQRVDYILDPNKYTGKIDQIVIPGDQINPVKHSQIIVEKSTPGFACASAVWHFSTEQLPKTGQGDFFLVSRKYYKRENKGQEWILKPLTDGEKVVIGDQIEVHISLTSKHESEYVQLRDPRAAGFEPENVNSGYHWEYGTSWYEEIRDSGSNFFFSKLPAGEYMFKYRLRATMAGQYRIGSATVQSMYAPEFNAYSAGDVLLIQ